MKRTLLSMFGIFILIVISASCTKTKEEAVNTEETDNSLTIYIYKNKEIIEEAVDIFNQSSNVKMGKKRYFRGMRERPTPKSSQ